MDEGTPAVADGAERALDPRAVVVRRIGAGVAAAILSAGSCLALVVSLLAARPTRTEVVLALSAWALLVVGVTVWSWVWPPVWYRHVSYRIDDQGIRIRTGVLWRSTISVPRSRVQHTDVRQGPVERGYGLATLILHTAGTQHGAVELSGLDRRTALGIRDHLIGVDD